ncbi:hypothetical protein FE251_07420 [Georgenia wutianyii]|uniref:Uncharacterized protein n=1 Tax=Georgenia wutianyii TaxID=2585135 RepID=A0ABX5VL65_9MICO|nr:DUF6338 family protein [Georgenia wutianyii]QDB79219.1 hypothetical protein FE251_07420 [Georgenia wutianyii]
MPETWMQVAVILAAVMPGFVYQVSRRKVAGPGPDEREFAVRVLRAVAASAVFAGVYAAAFGPTVVRYVREPASTFEDIRLVALAFLLLVVLVPWAAARAAVYLRTSRWFAELSATLTSRLRLRRSWNPTPSAWDYAFATVRPGWVRVRLSDGSWAGGWFGYDSFATSFPEPQELYLEVGYVMSEEGTFTAEVSAPEGVIIRCQDALVVDFIPPEN